MSARPEAGPDTSHLPVATALCEVLRHEAEESDEARRRRLEVHLAALWGEMQKPRTADPTIDEAVVYLRDLGIDPAKLVPALARQA